MSETAEDAVRMPGWLTFRSNQDILQAGHVSHTVLYFPAGALLGGGSCQMKLSNLRE